MLISPRQGKHAGRVDLIANANAIPAYSSAKIVVAQVDVPGGEQTGIFEMHAALRRVERQKMLPNDQTAQRAAAAAGVVVKIKQRCRNEGGRVEWR